MTESLRKQPDDLNLIYRGGYIISSGRSPVINLYRSGSNNPILRKCRKLNWLLRVTGDCSYEQQLKDILFNTSHSSALVAYYYLNLWRHLVGRSIEVCPPLFDFYVAEEVTNISFLSFYYKLKCNSDSGNIILARHYLVKL